MESYSGQQPKVKNKDKENSVPSRKSSPQKAAIGDRIAFGMRKMVEFVRNDAIKYVTIEVGTRKSLWIREFSDDNKKPAEIERKCMVYVKFANKSLNSYMNHIVDYV